jgi:type I restriction enzyme, S subunit
VNVTVPTAGLVTPLHRPDWSTRRLKFLFERRTRPVMVDDGIVTAFRDGVVTLRSNRREDGFTMADKEIGYQGVEPRDLVIHAMDGFAGAIGVSDSRGKCSPVYTIAVPRNGRLQSHTRFWAYYLRNLATSGFIQSLAKGIRERAPIFVGMTRQTSLSIFPILKLRR